MVALAVAVAVEGEVVVALAVTGSAVLVAGGVSVVVVGAVEEQKPVLMFMKPNLSSTRRGRATRAHRAPESRERAEEQGNKET
jgi:hypothetical protein